MSLVLRTGSWGLRDYGTGSWDGGDEGCDHLGKPFRTKSKLNENWGAGFSDVKNTEDREPMGQSCSKCGARRVDNQLGLEPTPDCGKLGLFRLRSDLTAEQREFVARRLAGVESHDA